MSHTPRSLRPADLQLAEFTMLCGFDDDLVTPVAQTINRIRGPFTQAYPVLECVLGPHLDHQAVVDLLQHYPSPVALTAASEKTLVSRLT